MQEFTLPRDMYHGKDALETLKALEGKKTIVCVGGGSIRRGGFLDRAVAYLKETGMEIRLLGGIRSDPSVETVMRGADEMLTFEPDWIVTMGGESPIDAAKAIWIKYEYPEITFEDMCKVFGIPKLRRKAQFCATSSTSGTTAEVVTLSIITDYQKGTEHPIADFEIAPDIAIVDPGLVTTMPIRLVAHTGMDVMTHAVEAYISVTNGSFIDPLAIRAIEMIKEHLIKSYSGDMDFHAAMHDAQYPVGQASSNVLLGIVHSIVHKTGAVFVDQGVHIIYGTANTVYLPKIIKPNAKGETARKRYGVVADYMRLGDSSDEEKMSLLIAYPRGISGTLRIPHCIARCGKDGLPTEKDFVSEDVFLTRVEDIAANAILGACTGNNPRQPSQGGMVKLLKCCYYDTEVDFQYRN